MFRKRKPKSQPKPRSAPEPTGVYKQPTSAEEERTETLKILLGEDIDLSLEQDLDPGSDPHDNTERLSVKGLRSK